MQMKKTKQKGKTQIINKLKYINIIQIQLFYEVDTSLYRPKRCISTEDVYNFVRAGKFFSFFLELYKNKFKNLIRISKFKFSFRGLSFQFDLYLAMININKMVFQVHKVLHNIFLLLKIDFIFFQNFHKTHLFI